ncbi:Toll-like receptor [Elysia marginata]|uniref:Toll-like receptor n=1 Tax=Elysia marginata TaxID=1093978 RepID=A0AAV4HHD8_9GAST|nr:Toll-like receptor [Elysia marginata]
MAAGVSISETQALMSVHSLVLGLLFMASIGAGNLFSEKPVACEKGCTCINYQGKYLMNCTVRFISPRISSLMLDVDTARNKHVGGADFRCSRDQDDVPAPVSALWDGALAGLSELRELIFTDCNLKRIEGSALRGLESLQLLVITGASISVLDDNLFAYTPAVRQLQVVHSGLTLVPALCKTGSNLRVLNFSSNALSSFDAAGVRCTGPGAGGSR